MDSNLGVIVSRHPNVKSLIFISLEFGSTIGLERQEILEIISKKY